MNMEIDLERRQKLLTARDKNNSYQRAYQAKRKAALTPKQRETFNARQREYQRAWRAKRKNNMPYYEKTLVESLSEAHERRKAYQRAWSAQKRATLTPEQLERDREYRRNYYAAHKEKIALNIKRRLTKKNQSNLNSKKETPKNENKRKNFIDSIIARS